ncbi:MAG: histidine phosphatase family protein [Rhodoferax sp.]|nr:histidine phosphatase family protein [Rhodoferax sp.]
MIIICRTRTGFLCASLLLAAACLTAPAPSARAAEAADTSLAPLVATVPQFVERAATPKTLVQLRQGGYVLYLRHGPTDNSKPDRLPAVDLMDCSTQRPLTDEGRALAARVGRAMRAAHIPIKNIHISPLCRVRDTASAAFPGRKVLVDGLLMYSGNLTEAQKAPIVANTRRLLSEPVALGSNRLVIAHAPNLMDLMGYFPREATLVLFRPRGQAGFDYVASIPPDLWAELLPPGAVK